MTRDPIEGAVAKFNAGDIAGARAAIEAITVEPGTDDEADRCELIGMIASAERRDAEALEALERALAVRKRLHGKTSAEAARGHAAVARHHATTGALALARRSSRLALKADPDDPELSILRGDLERIDSDYDAAERSYKRALARLRGGDRLEALRGLGNVYLMYGNARKARKLFREALALVDDPASLVAAQLTEGIGQACGALGDTEAAIEHLERALAMTVAAVGELHVDTATCLNNLALAFADEDARRAAAAMQYSIAIGEHVYRDHPSQATSMANLAYLCSDVEQPAMAVMWAERALAMQERLLAPDHIDVLVSRSNLAHYERERGDTARALAQARRLQELAPQLVESHQETGAAVLFSTGTLLLELADDRAGAAALFDQAIQLREALRRRKDDVVCNSVRNAAARLFVAGAVAEAIAILEAAIARARHPPFAKIYAAKLAAVRADDRDAVVEDTELEDDDDDDDEDD